MTQIGQLPTGSKCDRYEIVRLIGAGGMGEVYMALHEFTKKAVALKVLKVSHAAKEQHVEKMRAEAMVLCRIKHRNLVEVYDAGIADVDIAGESVPLIWMAMELLEGESLRERLVREGAIRPGLALQWIAQVASGIAEAHREGVIHRDLKPENVFITKKGDIRVLDFGTAKFQGFGHSQTTAEDRVGTVPYMAPEHLGDEPIDARSDVYALGFILYELLAGRHPFTDPQGNFPPMSQLVGMQLGGEPESLEPFVGAEVWQVVQGAIQKDPGARYPSMDAMAQACSGAASALGGDSGALRLSSANQGLGSGVGHATGTSGVTPAPLATSTDGAGQTRGLTGPTVTLLGVLALALGAGGVYTAAPSLGLAGPAADRASEDGSAEDEAAGKDGRAEGELEAAAGDPDDAKDEDEPDEDANASEEADTGKTTDGEDAERDDAGAEDTGGDTEGREATPARPPAPPPHRPPPPPPPSGGDDGEIF